MELNRDDRKQLAELMIEYHPRKNSQEPAQQDGTLPEQQRKYTCLNYNQSFSTSMGKYNHFRRRQDCQNADQGGTFENKCSECSRAFKAPVRLKAHQKYILSGLQKTMQTQEKPKTREDKEEMK